MDINFNTVMLLVIAAFQALAAYWVYMAKENIEKIEVATNSMKDALVKATGEAAHAAGREEGRTETGTRR